MADHNDRTAVNSLPAGIDISAADLYALVGFPKLDTEGGGKIVIVNKMNQVLAFGGADARLLINRMIFKGMLRQRHLANEMNYEPFHIRC